MSCQTPVVSKLIGGFGINNAKMALAGTCAYVDSLPDNNWIEVLSANVAVVSNAGNFISYLFICPESERLRPNLPIPATNGAGPIANNIGWNFTGVSIPLDVVDPAQRKSFSSNSRTSFLIPPGFFLRGAQASNAGADSSAVIHLCYLWRYCDSDSEGKPIIPAIGTNKTPPVLRWDYTWFGK